MIACPLIANVRDLFETSDVSVWLAFIGRITVWQSPSAWTFLFQWV